MKLIKIMQVSTIPEPNREQDGSVYRYRLYFDQVVAGQVVIMSMITATLLANSAGIQIIK